LCYHLPNSDPISVFLNINVHNFDLVAACFTKVHNACWMMNSMYVSWFFLMYKFMKCVTSSAVYLLDTVLVWLFVNFFTYSASCFHSYYLLDLLLQMYVCIYVCMYIYIYINKKIKKLLLCSSQKIINHSDYKTSKINGPTFIQGVMWFECRADHSLCLVEGLAVRHTVCMSSGYSFS
jgi:hypothetical protein